MRPTINSVVSENSADRAFADPETGMHRPLPSDTLSRVADAGLHSPQSMTSPEELRDLYRLNEAEERRATSRKGLWLAVFIYLLFSATDILLIRDVALYTIIARFAVGSVALLAIEFQYYFRHRADVLDVTCATALVSGYAFWLLPAMTSGEVINLSYYIVFGAIFMMGINLFFNFRFSVAIIASAAVLVAFLVSLRFSSGDIHHTLTFIIFYVCCFVFTSFVNWKLNKERYQVFLNSLEASNQHREATERGRALLRLSNTDPLTGLANRRAIDRTLRSYWEGWQVEGKSFAVLLIDVDHFKKFNDVYGHQEGDKCLVLVADALKKSVEKFSGTVGRYGGEEFIVLALASSGEQVLAFAEAVRRAVEDLMAVDGRVEGTAFVTVSVGAAITEPHLGTRLEKLIHQADRALYAAKASGRNTSRLYDKMDPDCQDDAEDLAALLKVALHKSLVSLVYQPIGNVVSGTTDKVEALMRLKTVDGTSISPSVFIPVAERTGAILDLGRWLIRSVCTEVLTNKMIEIATVNISPIQLKAEGFAASVAAILLETGTKGSRLAFEITEGQEMEVDSRILTCVQELRQLGIEIWLDDFGTGFAGLSWLRLIEFDTVKIDRSFLYGAETPRGKAMLQDIVGLLRNSGHNIVIEGVETEDQMALVRELWIDQVQGFHLGRPVSADKIQVGSPRKA
jgi:diguanylate cyclase (GGDEF)-like protein